MSTERTLLQIGEVAERVGLSLRTVRYYEEVGLVTPSAHTEGGFRLFSEEDVQRLLIVKRMKPLGLPLEEVRELVELLEHSARPEVLKQRALRDLCERLARYAERADERIERLERDLVEARQLRLRIGERLGRCEAALERTPTVR